MKKIPLSDVLLWIILAIGAVGAVLSALAIFAALGVSLYAAMTG